MISPCKSVNVHFVPPFPMDLPGQGRRARPGHLREIAWEIMGHPWFFLTRAAGE